MALTKGYCSHGTMYCRGNPPRPAALHLPPIHPSLPLIPHLLRRLKEPYICMEDQRPTTATEAAPRSRLCRRVALSVLLILRVIPAPRSRDLYRIRTNLVVKHPRNWPSIPAEARKPSDFNVMALYTLSYPVGFSQARGLGTCRRNFDTACPLLYRFAHLLRCPRETSPQLDLPLNCH